MTKKILIPVSSLRPAQRRYALEMVKSNTVSVENGIYDGGESLIVNAVLGKDQNFYSLIDHHHHVLKAIQEGATKCWVVVKNFWTIADYQDRLQKDKTHFSTNLSFYCRTLHGEWEDPFLSIEEFHQKGEQDHVRTFISLHKVKDRYENGILIKREKHETFKPFWQKVTGHPPKDLMPTPPFAEFILSDVLRAMGFLEHSMDTRHARVLLSQAKENPTTLSCFRNWKDFHLDWLYFID